MNIDFKTVNIANEEDWKELKRDFNSYFDGDESFDKYEALLSKLNIIVGFGRGFWAGVHGYWYIVFHKETKKFYWYLRDIESDDNVSFYELDENAEIFDLLNSKSIEGDFYEFDAELDYGMLYSLSIGDVSEMPTDIKPATLTELFGEDTEALRIALMNFRPASQGSKYPHKEFHKKIYLPIKVERLDEKVKTYNEAPFEVYRKGSKLLIDLNGEVFELKKV